MYIDFKETVWYRCDLSHLTESISDKVRDAIHNGELDCYGDLEFMLGKYGFDLDGEYLLDTSEGMSPDYKQENFATAELFNDDNCVVAKNGR